MKTPAEIKARITETRGSDLFGAIASSLLDGLAFADARELLKPEVTAEQWEPDGTAEYVERVAKDYLAFAIGKADDHRGLSAGRSIDHYRGWMWLLGKYDEIDWDDYPNYGAPILRRVSDLMGWADEWTRLSTPEISRMAEGAPCRHDCMDGCAS